MDNPLVDLLGINPKIMKDSKLLLPALLVFTIFIEGCVEGEPQPVLTASELLAGDDPDGRSYFISSAKIDLIDINGTLQLDECVTDNTIIYYPSGRYEENEGRTKCAIEDAPGSVGNWVIANNETEMSIVIDGVEEEWRIESVTAQGHTLTRDTNDGEITFILERLN